jgi:hypothetical protein
MMIIAQFGEKMLQHEVDEQATFAVPNKYRLFSQACG